MLQVETRTEADFERVPADFRKQVLPDPAEAFCSHHEVDEARKYMG